MKAFLEEALHMVAIDANCVSKCCEDQPENYLRAHSKYCLDRANEEAADLLLKRAKAAAYKEARYPAGQEPAKKPTEAELSYAVDSCPTVVLATEERDAAALACRLSKGLVDAMAQRAEMLKVLSVPSQARSFNDLVKDELVKKAHPFRSHNHAGETE